MNLLKSSLLVLILGVTSAASVARAAHASEVTLLYNASVHAELHDCGCKKKPLGGLARRAALIDHIAAEHPDLLLVDAGNLFGDPTQDTVAQSEFVAARTADMGYAAVGFGPFELGHGVQAVQEVASAAGLTFVSANVTLNGEPAFKPWTVVERNGVRFGLISVVDPTFNRVPYNGHTDGVVIEDPAVALARELPALRKACDVVVLLSNMDGADGSANLLQKLDQPVEIVVEGMVGRQFDEPRTAGASYLLAANARGKFLGQATLTVEGGQLTAVEGSMHELTLDLPEDQKMADEVSKFESMHEQLTQGR